MIISQWEAFIKSIGIMPVFPLLLDFNYTLIQVVMQFFVFDFFPIRVKK